MGLFGKKKAKAPDTFGDKHLTQAPQSIGQDSANEVFKVNYKAKHAMGGETAGYFKPDASMAPAKNAIAASRLAQGMGWGNLIPETHAATHDITNQHGQKQQQVSGAVSRAVTGEALQSPVFDTLKPGYKGKGSDTVKVKADGNAYEYSGIEMNDSLDLSKSNTQQQLNQLQWFDALIGNSDRHGANIMIDPVTGNVSGIDNDLSFSDGFAAKFKSGKKDAGYETGIDSKFLGLPEQLDASTADTLLKLDKKTIAKLLNPKKDKGAKMSDEELQQVYDRLELIQAKAQEHKDNNTLVQQWDATSYQDALNQQLTPGSWGSMNPRNYAQRHHLGVQQANDTSVSDHWIKGRRAETTTPPPQPTPPQPTVPHVASAQVSSSWQAPQKPAISGGRGLQLSGSRAQAPQSKPQAPVPPPQSAKPTNSGAQPPVRRLSSRVKDTPWADQLKRPKQKV
jgi:hypothetical protein